VADVENKFKLLSKSHIDMKKEMGDRIDQLESITTVKSKEN